MINQYGSWFCKLSLNKLIPNGHKKTWFWWKVLLHIIIPFTVNHLIILMSPGSPGWLPVGQPASCRLGCITFDVVCNLAATTVNNRIFIKVIYLKQKIHTGDLLTPILTLLFYLTKHLWSTKPNSKTCKLYLWSKFIFLLEPSSKIKLLLTPDAHLNRNWWM